MNIVKTKFPSEMEDDFLKNSLILNIKRKISTLLINDRNVFARIFYLAIISYMFLLICPLILQFNDKDFFLNDYARFIQPE